MDKQSGLVRNGDQIKLPIGFRFSPTDEELVVHYLKRKVFSLPLPASVIPELDVFEANPWSLPGDLKEKRYFFSKRKGNGKRCMRVIGSGYWKAIGKDKPIVVCESNQVVGLKRTLVFYEGKHPHVSRTHWFMHEYRLLDFQATPNLTQNSYMEVGNWVVYKVKQKKRRVKRNLNHRTTTKSTEIISPSCIDLMVEDTSDLGPPQPSSPSCSSEITEILSHGVIDQEESSGCNSLILSFSCLRDY